VSDISPHARNEVFRAERGLGWQWVAVRVCDRSHVATQHDGNEAAIWMLDRAKLPQTPMLETIADLFAAPFAVGVDGRKRDFLPMPIESAAILA
jgi:hypothetical protein